MLWTRAATARPNAARRSSSAGVACGRDSGLGTVSARPGLSGFAFAQVAGSHDLRRGWESVPKSRSAPACGRDCGLGTVPTAPAGGHGASPQLMASCDPRRGWVTVPKSRFAPPHGRESVPKPRSVPPHGRDSGLGTVSAPQAGLLPAFPQFTAPRVSAIPAESVPKSRSAPPHGRDRGLGTVFLLYGCFTRQTYGQRHAYDALQKRANRPAPWPPTSPMAGPTPPGVLRRSRIRGSGGNTAPIRRHMRRAGPGSGSCTRTR